MFKKTKIELKTLRFPITSNILDVEREVEEVVNELYRDPKTQSVEIRPCHNSYYFVYDIIAEVNT